MTDPTPISPAAVVLDDGAGGPAARGAPGRGIGGRIAWVVVDQTLSSASNIGTGIIAARSLDRHAFGAYGLAFTIYLLTVGTTRALVTEPMVSLYSRAEPGALRSVMRAATGSAVAIGISVGAVVAMAAAVLGGPAGHALTVLAIAMPGLLLQDAWRYCFVTAGRPRAAVVNDALWCFIQVATLLILLRAPHVTLTAIMVWWAGAGVLTGLIGCAQARATPALKSILTWLRKHRELSSRYALEYAVATGSSQATVLALGAIAGLAALGAIRGTQVFFGPIGVLFGGAYLTFGAEGARLRADPERLNRLMLVCSGALFVVCATSLAIGIVLPRHVGRSLFGDTWDTTRQVLIPVGIAFLGNCVAAGGVVGLRALAAARASLRARLLGLPVAVVAPVVGALWGAHGFAIGLAIATWSAAAIWWRQFVRALAEDLPPAAVIPDLLV
jgi:O-antigen/teichoic acid export membrane protein